jgi:hypothetical protein
MIRRVARFSGALLIVALVLFERLDVFPTPYSFEADGSMRVMPVSVRFVEPYASMLFTSAVVAAMLVNAVFVGRVHRRLASAQERLTVLAWHLKQLAPHDTSAHTRAAARREMQKET